MGYRKNVFGLLALIMIPLMYGLWRVLVHEDERVLHEVYGTDVRSAVPFTNFLIVGVVATCILLLLAWRNSAALTAKRRHEELLAAQRGRRTQRTNGKEDPAIVQARELWNQQRPQEAVRVLIARIRELNEE